MKKFILAMCVISSVTAANAQFGNILGDLKKAADDLQKYTQPQSQPKIDVKNNPKPSEQVTNQVTNQAANQAAISKEDAAMDEELSKNSFNPGEYKSFFFKLKKAINANDKIEISNMISYPLKTQNRVIKSNSEFVNFYDEVFPEALKTLIRNQKYANLFSNSQGVMIGNGDIWFSEVCVDKNCNQRVVKIIANNYSGVIASKKISSDASKPSSKIPRKFQGIWGDNAKECKLLMENGTDFSGTVVKEKEVNQPELFCEVILISISPSDDNKINGSIKCSSPDGDTIENISMALIGGKLKINNSKSLMHCN